MSMKAMSGSIFLAVLFLCIAISAAQTEQSEQPLPKQEPFPPIMSPSASRTGILASYPGFFSPLTLLIIVPLIFLFLSLIFGGGHTGGYYRSSSRSAPFSPYLSSMEMVRLAKKVLSAIESDTCRRRSVCEMGAYVKGYGATKDMIISTLENLAPQNMQSYVALVKEAAKSNSTDQFCELFQCDTEAPQQQPNVPERGFNIPPSSVNTKSDNHHTDTFVNYQ